MDTAIPHRWALDKVMFEALGLQIMRNASDKSLCPLCGGKKVAGRTTYVAAFAPRLLVVRNVPAMICSQCGEEWIDAKTAQQLEQMVAEAKHRKHELEVVAL